MSRLQCSIVCAAVGGLVLGASSVQAAVKTWSGVNGQWYTPAEWTPSGNPDLITPNDTAVINAGAVTYTPGGDFIVNSSLDIASGASWTQTSSGAWIKFGNTGFTGVVNVSGSFNAGGAGNLFVGNGGTGQVSVTGGSLVANNVIVAGTGSFLAVSAGGSVSATGMTITTPSAVSISGAGSAINMATSELKPNSVAAVTLTGGTLNVNRLGFDGAGANTVVLNSGRINITDGVNFNGIFSAGGDDYVNFTGTSGVVFLGTDATLSNANAAIADGRVRLNGAINLAAFQANTVTGGVEISLVPEPATCTVLFGAAATILRRRRL